MYKINAALSLPNIHRVIYKNKLQFAINLPKHLRKQTFSASYRTCIVSMQINAPDVLENNLFP